jgi:hypothetical protein
MGHIMNESAWNWDGRIFRERSAVLKSVSAGAHCSRFTDRLKGDRCEKGHGFRHCIRITHFKKQRHCSEFTDFYASYAEGVTLFLTPVTVLKNIEHTDCGAETGLI